MADGVTKSEVMSKDEVESIRKRSKAGGSGPWVTDWCEMAKKTAFRRCSKWLPLSPDINEAFERDDDRIVDAVQVQPMNGNRTAFLESQLDGMLSKPEVTSDEQASSPQDA
jgi:recombination protein RecT